MKPIDHTKYKETQVDKDVRCRLCRYTAVAKSIVYRFRNSFLCASCRNILRKRDQTK